MAMTENERIAARALEIAEELRKALPLNTDFGPGWQQRYLERQNERYEKALEMARAESAEKDDAGGGKEAVMCAESGRPCTRGCVDACYWQRTAGADGKCQCGLSEVACRDPLRRSCPDGASRTEGEPTPPRGNDGGEPA